MASRDLPPPPEERPARRAWLIALGVTILGFVIAIPFIDEPPPKKIRIGTGSAAGRYHELGQAYAKALREQGLKVELVPSRGSVENIANLRSGAADIAFVQGGTVQERGDLSALATLYVEPLWCFHRHAERKHLGEFTGARLAVGAPGSGTRVLTERILGFHGIGEQTAELLDIPSRRALENLRDGEIDALFLVGAASMPLVRQALDSGLSLLDLSPFAEAYESRLSYLKGVTLHRGMLDIEAPEPRHDVGLVAATTSLVAREALHSGLIPPLLDTAKEIHEPGGLLEDEGDFPSWKWAEVPLEESARRYLEDGPGFLYRIFPYRYAILFDRTKVLLLPLITLLLPLLRIAPPLYRWRTRAKIFRWYKNLRYIEERIRSGDRQEGQRRLRAIEDEIASVKVPLGYMWELYSLRTHIDFVREHFELPRGEDPSAGDSPPAARD